VSWAVFASGLIPQGLVVDRDGHLYVSDLRDNRVVRYEGGVPGSPILLAGSGSGAGQVTNPHGLAIDCRMNLHVADTGNNRILTIPTADSTRVPNTGTVLAGSGAGLNPAQVTAPQGVAVDSAGKLYVADTGNHRVLAIASAPVPGAATAVCTQGSALGQVVGPEGVTVTAFTAGVLAGVTSVVVSDTANNRVQARPLPAGPWLLLGGPALLKLPSKIR
jgi:sugar lactone lactonase YvrE